jgi:hypothetical protein
MSHVELPLVMPANQLALGSVTRHWYEKIGESLGAVAVTDSVAVPPDATDWSPDCDTI